MIVQLLRKVFKPVPLHQRLIEDIKKTKGGISTTLTIRQEDVYKTMYFETKYLFNNVLKAGRLSREQILYIKFMLNEFLLDYKQFYPNRYKNDAHEIYSKLKSPFLDNTHYSKINKTILKFTNERIKGGY